jgi:hypothetical protein
VTQASPNNGASVAAGGPDLEDKEMIGNTSSNDFLWSMNHDGVGLRPQAAGGTNWTVMGSDSDPWITSDSATNMGSSAGSVHKVIFYDGNYNSPGGRCNPQGGVNHCTYAHGEMKKDTRTGLDCVANRSDTQVQRPGDVPEDQWQGQNGSQPHAGLWTYYGLTSTAW